MSKKTYEIRLADKGVYRLNNRHGKRVKERVAPHITLNAIGVRDSDHVRFVDICFMTDAGDIESKWFKKSALLIQHREVIRTQLADLGYDWPDDRLLSDAILRAVATSQPEKRFRIVGAPGWYGSEFVLPDEIFGKDGNSTDIRIDPDTDAHVGAFAQGDGSLKGWKQFVAKPSCKSSRARLAISAALAAPFLRPLGFDSFGINYFSPTSDGKTLLLKLAASVTGLIGGGGLPAWADSEAGIEDLARGHRDCVMPLDETADGDHGRMPLKEKARMLAFLIARNRPRNLSRKYEKENALTNREFRIIALSSSERALGQIARDAGNSRLGGEEVRLIDVPASEPGSFGIFDTRISQQAGRTIQETTKELADDLAARAKKHQGFALRELLDKFVRDPDGLRTITKYKKRFEAKAKLEGANNASYRIRGNFAVIWAAAALAIDYEILPWGKRKTFDAIKKCMIQALESLETTRAATASANITTSEPAHHLASRFCAKLSSCILEPVTLRRKPTPEQIKKRTIADAFLIDGWTYLKSNRFRDWFPVEADRMELQRFLKTNGVLHTKRSDTPTCAQLISGIKGKARYFVIDCKLLAKTISLENRS